MIILSAKGALAERNAPYEGQPHNGAIRYAIAPYKLIGGEHCQIDAYVNGMIMLFESYHPPRPRGPA